MVRWRRGDLSRKIARMFGVHLHERSVGKLLHRLGFRHLSVRPRHPQADSSAQQAHKKTVPRLKLWVAQGIIGSHERRWWAATT